MHTQREVQKFATREVILQAAATEFAVHGYNGTTFSSIAAAMGKPKSAVGYHHFTSKLSLAGAIVERQWVRWQRLLDDAESLAPGLVRVLAIMLSAVLDAERNAFAAATVRLMTERDAGIPLPDWAFSWRSYGREQIERDIAAGRLDAKTDSRDVVQSLLVTTFGVRSTKQHGFQDIDTEDRLRRVWRDVISGLGLDPVGCLGQVPAGGIPMVSTEVEFS